MTETRKIYTALHRTIRKRERYYNALENATNDNARDYHRGLWELQCKKMGKLTQQLPRHVLFSFESPSSESDPYHDWGWLYQRLPLWKAHEILERSSANQRDLWTRKHPMPHNDKS